MELNIRGHNRLSIRNGILDFEKRLSEMDGALVGEEATSLGELKHSFSDGIYVRECVIRAGCVVVGKIHSEEHPVFLLKGRARVLTETNGIEDLQAPWYGISPAGTKRVVISITETVWVTVHKNPTNSKDLKFIEDNVISKNYEQIRG